MKKLLALCLALIPSGSIFAATEPASPPQDIMKVTTLDEVVVTGELDTLSGLTKAIHEAEDRFYERYNTLNPDDRLDAQCRSEAPTGTRLNVRTCQPRAVDDATRSEALRLVAITDGNRKLASTYDIRTALSPAMKQRTLQMLQKDPELRRALLEHARLVKMYDELREKKFQQHFVVWD